MAIPPAGTAAFQSAARILSALLEARTGQILSEGRAWRMETALRPVLRTYGFQTIDDLAATLLRKRDPRLDEAVVNALLNNESSFFRDLQVFDMIHRQILPQIQQDKADRTLRIWSAGCSTGQEAYSLAIRLRNEAERWQGWRIEILATDISSSAIEQARAGIFAQMDVQRGLAVNDLIKWFEPHGDDWRVSPQLRRMIDFRRDNLFDPKAPSGAYDLILCRNVLLYFTPERRAEVLRLLARHSHDRSVLLLGAGETVIGHGDDFLPHADFRGGYAPQPFMAKSAAGSMCRVG
ncbi:CheR family methyltransferase [Sphingobium sp.]|uniref:CheR family methyltransferase n=1 Tax=Sphingobium sp. TaxID=1912891 RepID=UPI003B3B0FBC